MMGHVYIDHAQLAKQQKAHDERSARLGRRLAWAKGPQAAVASPEMVCQADAHVLLRKRFLEKSADAHVRLWRVVMRRPIDLDVMDLEAPPAPRHVDDSASWTGVSKVKTIIGVVAGHYKITPLDLLSRRNSANIVWPRQVAMYLAKRLTTRSLPDIGRRMAGRDHTTVLHAVRKIEAMIEENSELDAEINLIIRKIVMVRE